MVRPILLQVDKRRHVEDLEVEDFQQRSEHNLWHLIIAIFI